VQCALHTATGKRYAVKEVDKRKLALHAAKTTNAMAACEVEAAVLRSFAFPGIVRLHGSFETDEHRCYVLDLLPGGTLSDRILMARGMTPVRQTPSAMIGTAPKLLPLRYAKIILAEIAHAAAHLHAHGVLIRDIKSDNCCFDENGHAVLIDFGLAKIFRDDADFCADEPGEELMKYTAVGTETYVAPEIVRGEEHYDGKVDVWSLGIMLYEMVYLQLPFDDRVPIERMKKIVSAPLVFPSEAACKEDASQVNALLLRMLAKLPAERPSMAQVLDDPFIAGDPDASTLQDPAKIRTLFLSDFVPPPPPTPS